MADEQEIDVKLEPEVQIPAPAGTEAVVEAKQPADDEAITELKRQYEDLKKRDEQRTKATATAQAQLDEARRTAAQATTEAEQAKTRAAGTELQAVNDKLSAAKNTSDASEREYAAAMEAGNWQEAAKAQRRLSKAEADQVALERDKTYLENRAPATEGRVTPPHQPATDPFEAVLARATPTTREWLREHPDVVTDDEMRGKAAAADAAARKKGLRPDTDDYFRFAEEYLYGETVEVAPKAQQRPNGQTRRTMPAAPPSRDAASSPATSTTKVKLSHGEMERATDGTIVWNTGPNKGKPIGVQEMAKRKVLLEREGAYTRRLPS